MSLLAELKRRNVFGVAADYLLTAWLVIPVIETILPAFGLEKLRKLREVTGSDQPKFREFARFGTNLSARNVLGAVIWAAVTGSKLGRSQTFGSWRQLFRGEKALLSGHR